jgi:hypothetical protein
MGGFRNHDPAPAGWSVTGVSTVQGEADTLLFQAFAQCTGIVISEPEVDDRRRNTIVLDEAGCFRQGSRRQDDGTGVLKRYDNVEGNDRLILDDEN